MASSNRAFSFSTAYAKYGSLVQLEVAAGDRERERETGEVEGRVEEGDAGTQRAYGNEECDREMGSGG